jgi:hypothetical protein
MGPLILVRLFAALTGQLVARILLQPCSLNETIIKLARVAATRWSMLANHVLRHEDKRRYTTNKKLQSIKLENLGLFFKIHIVLEIAASRLTGSASTSTPNKLVQTRLSKTSRGPCRHARRSPFSVGTAEDNALYVVSEPMCRLWNLKCRVWRLNRGCSMRSHGG